MFIKLKTLVKGIKWLANGADIKIYLGYHCGCCGNWVEESIAVPEFISCGELADSWGVCPNCREEGEREMKRRQIEIL